jgi:hypothetical protein
MRKNLLFLFLILAIASIAATPSTKKKSAPPPKAKNKAVEQPVQNIAVAENNYISFSTFFLDSSGKFSFIYPVALPNAAALPELQKNFIRQQFGEKFLELEPMLVLESYVSQNEDIKFLTGEVSFPFSGIVQFQSSFYLYSSTHGIVGSNVCIYSISDGKKIDFGSIFAKGWEKGIAKLIIKEFLLAQNLQSLIDYGYTEKESDFVPSSARLSASGMEFVFPANQIAPFVAGEQNVFLSWNTLNQYLDKQSAIYAKIQF